MNNASRLTMAQLAASALWLAGLSGCASPAHTASASPVAADRGHVVYDTIEIDGVEIFYREAGPQEAPTLFLLHGYPTSSHMFCLD